MLKSIRLQNFFSFADCTIDLHPKVSVLVGINGSGKSNLFRAVRLINKYVETKKTEDLIWKTWGGPDRVTNSSLLSDEAKIILNLDASLYTNYPFGKDEKPEEYENIFYELLFLKLGQNKYEINNQIYRLGLNDIKNHKFSSISPLLYSDSYLGYQTLIYSTFDTSELGNIRKPAYPSVDDFLKPDGSNLAQLLNKIKIDYKDSYKRILDNFLSVNNNYSNIDFNLIGGTIEILLEEKKLKRSVNAANISDGTLRFLCLLTILNNPFDRRLICIDEPETGLHPDMISTIADAIKYCSEKNQVIISTHSDHLLNEFDLENIRVFEKDENNCTIVKSYTEDEFKSWEGRFSTGRMWRNGELGGNRW